MNEVVLNKVDTIEKCVSRIKKKYSESKKALSSDFDAQDIIILNLQRACEASIDLAMHIVRVERLGLPQMTRDAFRLLYDGGFIPEALCKRMQAMIGFRNIAVHNYTELDMEIVKKIIEEHLSDFLEFTKAIIKKSD